MKKEEIIEYLKSNKDIIVLSAIARNSGFGNLSKVVSNSIDSNGRPYTFPDKYIKPVEREIQRLQVFKKVLGIK